MNNLTALAISRRNQGELFGKQGNKAEQLELWKKSIETNNTIGIPTKEDEVEMDEFKRNVSDID